MQLSYHKKFLKSFFKLSASDQKQTKETVEIFRSNPLDPSLQNHKLKGSQKGFRSFSVRHDLRIIYKEEGNHTIVLLIKVGSHDQVYRS